MQTVGLKSDAAAAGFYDQRYREGYMDEWPAEKKARVGALVTEIAAELGLPSRGRALELGTGNGVFAEVLRQALPTWEIYGSDISEVSLAKARERFPSCTFLNPGALRESGLRFDLIFSHHVLEHVLDVRETLADVARLAAPHSTMLHILPCGNEGSLEHRLCRLHEGGIDPNQGNRFVFEDEGHLRRLTSAELADLAAADGFVLVRAYFANQFWGAVEWITNYDPRVRRQLTSPAGLAPSVSRARVLPIHIALATLSALRRVWNGYCRAMHSRPKGAKQWAVLACAWPLLPGAFATDALLRRKARVEWDRHRKETNGSEMYLVFSRHAPEGAP